MKSTVVCSMFLAVRALASMQGRAEDEVRLDLVRVYFVTGSKGVAVAIPENWKETSKTRFVEPGTPIRLRDEADRSVEIPSEAVARAFKMKSVLWAYDYRKDRMVAQ